MRLSIAERLRPFSHTPGTACLIPGTFWRAQAFPTLLRFSHQSQIIELGFDLTGPVEGFTLEQDLEKRVLFYFGKAKEGYFRLRIEALAKGLSIFAEKIPLGELMSSRGVLRSKESLFIPIEWTFYQPSHLERLSLGSHKKQDWDAVQRRFDLKEIVPLLFYLAQLLPKAEIGAPLFPENREEAARHLTSFFQVHCANILEPRLKDELHQGIKRTLVSENIEPCSLLHDAASWVRSLFIQTSRASSEILPHLPPQFPSGRLLNVSLGLCGALDMEWASSSLRKVILRAAACGEYFFVWPKNVVSFRVRTDLFEKGFYQKREEPFMLKAGTTYFLDRFQS